MGEGERWWKELNDGLKNDPVFIAEGIALDIALNVSDRLTQLGMTQKDLASRLGVSAPYVSQILGGQTNLTVLTLCRLSRALRLKLSITLREPRVRELITATDDLTAQAGTSITNAVSGPSHTAKPVDSAACNVLNASAISLEPAHAA